MPSTLPDAASSFVVRSRDAYQGPPFALPVGPAGGSSRPGRRLPVLRSLGGRPLVQRPGPRPRPGAQCLPVRMPSFSALFQPMLRHTMMQQTLGEPVRNREPRKISGVVTADQVSMPRKPSRFVLTLDREPFCRLRAGPARSARAAQTWSDSPLRGVSVATQPTDVGQVFSPMPSRTAANPPPTSYISARIKKRRLGTTPTVV